jgi:hypothetical protein
MVSGVGKPTLTTNPILAMDGIHLQRAAHTPTFLLGRQNRILVVGGEGNFLEHLYLFLSPGSNFHFAIYLSFAQQIKERLLKIIST